MKVLLNRNHLEIYGVENGHLEVFNLQGQPQLVQSKSQSMFRDEAKSKSGVQEVKYVDLNPLQVGFYFLKLMDRGSIQIRRIRGE